MTTLLVCASLGLNAFLVAKLLHRKPSLPSQPATAFPRPVGKSGTGAAAAATHTPPSFRWSAIESADYRQYIANLRAVGCPEQVIRDIIVADLNQCFAPRAAAIWQPCVSEYWQKSQNEEPSPVQMKQLLALSKDKAAILRELLGARVGDQQMIDTVFMQLHGSEQQLLYLPPDRREAALQALNDAEFEMREAELHRRDGNPRAGEQKLFDEKRNLLAKVLSPEELVEFRLRNSETAQSLRYEVQYFNYTRDEFRQLMDSREHAGDKNLGDLMNRTAAAEEVRKLFGEERAKEFERVTDLYYINARKGAEEQGVPLERVDQAWQVSRDARAAAGLVAKNSNLSAEERTSQVRALVQQAEARLNELLGQPAARAVIRDLRVGCNAKPPP